MSRFVDSQKQHKTDFADTCKQKKIVASVYIDISRAFSLITYISKIFCAIVNRNRLLIIYGRSLVTNASLSSISDRRDVILRVIRPSFVREGKISFQGRHDDQASIKKHVALIEAIVKNVHHLLFPQCCILYLDSVRDAIKFL